MNVVDLQPPHVVAAYEVLHGPRTRTECGRPTKAGDTCEQVTSRLLPSCRAHASPDELGTAAAEQARLAAVLADWEVALTPACHGWPVNDEHRQAAEAVTAISPELEPFWRAADLLRTWQQSRCAICAAEAAVVDHDHETGLARGWLCRSCNRVETLATTGDFLRYRERPPAAMLGLEVPYLHPRHGPAKPAA